MILYGLKNCDTCRKAMKSLPDARFCDVRAEGIPTPVLQAAHKQFGADLINTRSTTWRNLDESARARDALELLADYPALMKRPLIERDGVLFLSWSKDVQNTLLG